VGRFQGQPGKRSTIAAGAGIVVAVLVVATGVALAGLSDHSKTKTIGPSGKGAVTAKCPKGSEAAAGGFVGAFSNPDGKNLGFASRRTTARGWKAGAWNLDETHSAKLTAHAYCSKRPLHLKVKTAKKALGFEQQGSATAKCPRGTKVVSGGFAGPFSQSGVGASMFVYSSKRVGKARWRAAAANEGGAKGTLTAFAYCKKHAPRLTPHSKKITVSDPNFPKKVTARCPTGSQAFSGGFDNPEFGPNVDDSAIVPYESFRSSKRKWTVGGRNFADSGTLVAYAYCSG
jgi:hypothetical protein